MQQGQLLAAVNANAVTKSSTSAVTSNVTGAATTAVTAGVVILLCKYCYL